MVYSLVRPNNFFRLCRPGFKKIMDSKTNRFEVLDALRGIAAVVVMLFHYLAGYHYEFGFSSAPVIAFEDGFFGVQLFFIISGFVIYYSITNSKNVPDFLIRRFIRLFPTYWCCMFITFAVVSYYSLSPIRETTFREALINLSMIQGLFSVKYVDTSYWSLQIELFFYFFVALIFSLGVQRFLNFILAGWLLLIVFYNFVYKIPGAGLLFNLQYGMLFVAGIAFYKIKVLKQNNFFNHFIIVCSYIICLAVLRNMRGYLFGISAVYIVFYLAIYGMLPFLKNSVLLFLGKISYALYLIHDNIGMVVLQQLKMYGYNSPNVVVFPIAVSVILAWLITFYYETFITKWLRKKLLPRKVTNVIPTNRFESATS